MLISSLRCSTLFLVVCSLVDSTVLHHRKISPVLEPESDKKFFGKDYPRDHRPVADKHYVFGHPYPAVQDTGAYDADFVKDENDDGGKWKAQMDYDILRQKIRAAEKKQEELRKKLEAAESAWKKASGKYKDASLTEEELRVARSKAEHDAQKAAARVNELEGSSSADGTKVGGAVGRAMDKVNKEMTDLEKCKEELAKAKKQLKDLLAEKERVDGQNKKTTEENQVAKTTAEKKAKAEADETARKEAEEQKAKEAAEDKAAEARKSEQTKADEEVEARTKEEAAFKKKIDEEKAEHQQASKTYEEELADVKRTEAELKRAAENLRKYRRPPYVDDDGGVYYEPDGEKSASGWSSTCSAFLLALTVVMATR